MNTDITLSRRWVYLMIFGATVTACALMRMGLGLSVVLGGGDSSMHGHATSVLSGDTLEIESGGVVYAVRLREIDAPDRGQVGFDEARDGLVEKVNGKRLRVVGSQRDGQGRLLAHVYDGNRSINLAQIEDGLAWCYMRYTHSDGAERTEALARENRRGIWAKDSTIPPWEFRHERRSK